MRDEDKRRVGEELEPGDRPKAPGRLALLQRFINTHNHDFPHDWDRLGTKAKANDWLAKTGLGSVASADEAAHLRAFRESLRAHLVGRAAPPIELAHATIVVGEDGHTALRPSGGGLAGVQAALLAILHDAQHSGEWTRMKGCRQCEYAFYDRSKNRSATWCSMAICGNRTKNRTYYRRHHGP